MTEFNQATDAYKKAFAVWDAALTGLKRLQGADRATIDAALAVEREARAALNSAWERLKEIEGPQS